MAEAINDPETDVVVVGLPNHVHKDAAIMAAEAGNTDMLNALDSGQEPMENFYDGYVVNAIMDACYRSAKSKKWEKVELEE